METSEHVEVPILPPPVYESIVPQPRKQEMEDTLQKPSSYDSVVPSTSSSSPVISTKTNSQSDLSPVKKLNKPPHPITVQNKKPVATSKNIPIVPNSPPPSVKMDNKPDDSYICFCCLDYDTYIQTHSTSINKSQNNNCCDSSCCALNGCDCSMFYNCIRYFNSIIHSCCNSSVCGCSCNSCDCNGCLSECCNIICKCCIQCSNECVTECCKCIGCCDACCNECCNCDCGCDCDS